MENETASEQAAGKPVLAWLQIHALPERNVDPCRLRFGERFNVLLGLNASGKTTLLEIIVAAMRFDFSKFAGGPFDVEYELRVPGAVVHARIQNIRTSVESHPLIPRSSVGEPLTYFAEFRVRTTAPDLEWTIQVSPDGVRVNDRQGLVLTRPGPTALPAELLLQAFSFVSGKHHEADSEFVRVFLALHSAGSKLERFDEGLGFFDVITHDAAWVEIGRVADGSGAWIVWGIGVVLVGLGEQIALKWARQSPEGGDNFSISQQDLPFLANVAALLDFEAIHVELRLLERTRFAGQERLRFGDFRFTFERHDGSLITHAKLSYGQKRLLSLLYYLEMHPHTVVADELVDGLHNRWIDDAIEVIGERQAFLASQNPLILDHLEFSSPEEVAATFVVCRIEKRDDGERLVWANMSDVDAERFFRAYEVGIQHVSEILLSKGLW